MTPSGPSWTILIPTIGRRAPEFQRLIDQLMPQVQSYQGLVQVTGLWNNGEWPLGTIRQELVASAVTDYVSFVDDDDELPPYHVDKVMTALVNCQPDYVGWRMQCFVDGVALKPTFHSLEYHGWWDDTRGYYRDVSHLNPIRRELALRADFRRGDPPEDVAWVDQVRPHLAGATQCYLDDVMYHYRSRPLDSTWYPGSVSRDQGYDPRADVHWPYFRWHPWSFTEEDRS